MSVQKSFKRCSISTLAVLISVLWLSVLTPASAAVKNYYVSPSGSNSNAGTLAAPFLTLGHARDVVRTYRTSFPNDDIYVYLRGGTYPLTDKVVFTEDDSGTDGHPIHYENYQSEIPTLSGGVALSGWTKRSPLNPLDPVYKKASGVTAPVRSFYLNGVRAKRTSTTPGPYWTKMQWGYLTGGDNRWNSYINLGSIELVWRGQPKWAEPRCSIKALVLFGFSVQGSDLLNLGCFHMITSDIDQQRNVNIPTSIENVYELLQNGGEWYLDRSGASGQMAGTVYYVPKAGENMSTATGVLPILETLISISGTEEERVKNLHFKGLSFQHTNYLTPDTNDGFAESQHNFSDHVVANAYDSDNKVTAALRIRYAEQVSIENNRFTKLGGAGLNVERSEDVDIFGNVFSDLSSSAIQVGDSKDYLNDDFVVVADVEIKNNHIYKIGAEFHGAVGMWIGYSKRVTVANNQINDFPYTGISMSDGPTSQGELAPLESDYNKITSNLIFDGVKYLSDAGCIYQLRYQRGQTVRGNVCYDMQHFAGGLYTDEDSSHIKYVNNVIYANSLRDTISHGSTPLNTYFHLNFDDVTMMYSFADIGIDRILDQSATVGNAKYQVPYPRPTTSFPMPAPTYPLPSTTDAEDYTMFPASIVNVAGLDPDYVAVANARYPSLLPVKAVPSDTTAPSKPGGGTVAIVLGDHGAKLTWNDPNRVSDGVTGYEVVDVTSGYVLAASQGPCVVIGNFPSQPAGDLIPNTSYTVHVKARDAAGNLSSSAIVPFTTLLTAPPEPTACP